MAYRRIKKDGTPSKKPGRPRGPEKPKSNFDPRALRPDRWITGLDEEKHEMYLPFLKAKAQAKFRGEGWDLVFDDFFKLWKGKWAQRGRKGHDLCMTRIDTSSNWSGNNIELITRREHMARQGLAKIKKRELEWPEGMSYYFYRKLKEEKGL